MPGRTARPLRILSGLAAIVCGVLLSGCAWIHANLLEKCGPLNARVSRSVDARTASSVEEWERAVNNGRAVLDYTEVRAAMLLAGLPPENAALRSRWTSRGSVRWGVEVRGGFFLGTAVPVTEDGYFLTAAHCVDASPLTLIACVRGGLMQKAAASVVWRGAPDVDLAVLHAPLRPVAPFPPEQITLPHRDDPVGLFGWSTPTAAGGRAAAGKVIAFSDAREKASGTRWRTVYHNAPLLEGNSGGPLVARDGALIGINTQGGFQWSTLLRALVGTTGSPERPLKGYTAEALSPDPAWLRRLIRSDRAARAH